MNKSILTLLLCLFSFSAFSQYSFTIEINSKTLSNKKIYLNIINNRDHTIIKSDSVILNDGHGTLFGQVSQPSNIAVFYIANKRYVDTYFFLDSGINKVQLETPVTEPYKRLNIISDSRGNMIYNVLDKIFTDQVDHSSTPARENGYLKLPLSLSDQINAAQLQRLADFPADYAALLYLYRMSRMSDRVDQAKAILTTLAGFNDTIRNSPLGKLLYEEKSGLINGKHAAKAGNDVPVFQVNDIYNKPFTNRSLQGHNYIVVFSATWCGPCQLQLPKLMQLYQEYRSRGLKVIYFNIDDNVTKWKEHVVTNDLQWINVSERLKPSESKIQKLFGVYSIPSSFIINKDGKIIYNSDDTDTGIDHMQEFLRRLMN